MQENICLTMEASKCATTVVPVRLARTVRLRVSSVVTGSSQMQLPKLQVVHRVAQESTVIKIFNIPKHRVKVVWRGHTPRPKVLQAVPVATIALQANIQRQLQKTLMKTNAFRALQTRTVRNKEEILHVTWFHLDSIDLVPPPKLNARRVKQDVVATQHAKIAALDGFKNYQAILRAVNAMLVITTTQKVRRRATLSLPVPIIGTKKFANVIRVTIVLV